MQKSNLIKRMTAMVVILSLLVATVATYVNRDVIFKPHKTVQEMILDDKDRKTAEDISMLSGVSANKLMELRSDGKNWNEIMELVKDKKVEESFDIGDLDKRLLEEGFVQDDIAQAKAFVDRMLFALNEITRDSSNITPLQQLDITNSFDTKNETDITEYKELYEKIDKDTAIYYALKLQQLRGSIEAALDEYLYSIQIDVDISLCIIDRKLYEEALSEKSAAKSREQTITLMKIENKMINMLNSSSKQITDDANTPGIITENTWSPPEIPELTANNRSAQDLESAIVSPMPKDPASVVMDEINDIVNRSLN